MMLKNIAKQGGLRAKGLFKNASSGDKPLITVITVTYNSKDNLEKTVQSVLNQSYENIEYIIIDGSSTDGTVDIIKKYEDKIDYWVSEKDAGIYDAMNKGIALAMGEYIMFMNSGDRFFDINVLKELSVFLRKNQYPEIIYGKTVLEYDENYKKIENPGENIKFWFGLPFCHQSMVIKTKLQKGNLFNTSYNIYSDYDNYYKLWVEEHQFTYVDETISCFNFDGLSSRLTLEGFREMYQIGSKYKKFNRIKFTIYFFDKVLRAFLKKILPLSIKRKIQISK